jgi:hypothetical protein
MNPPSSFLKERTHSQKRGPGRRMIKLHPIAYELQKGVNELQHNPFQNSILREKTEKKIKQTIEEEKLIGKACTYHKSNNSSFSIEQKGNIKKIIKKEEGVKRDTVEILNSIERINLSRRIYDLHQADSNYTTLGKKEGKGNSLIEEESMINKSKEKKSFQSIGFSSGLRNPNRHYLSPIDPSLPLPPSILKRNLAALESSNLYHLNNLPNPDDQIFSRVNLNCMLNQRTNLIKQIYSHNYKNSELNRNKLLRSPSPNFNTINSKSPKLVKPKNYGTGNDVCEDKLMEERNKFLPLRAKSRKTRVSEYNAYKGYHSSIHSNISFASINSSNSLHSNTENSEALNDEVQRGESALFMQRRKSIRSLRKKLKTLNKSNTNLRAKWKLPFSISHLKSRIKNIAAQNRITLNLANNHNF